VGQTVAREGGPREATPINCMFADVAAECGVFEQRRTSLYYYCSGHKLASYQWGSYSSSGTFRGVQPPQLRNDGVQAPPYPPPYLRSWRVAMAVRITHLFAGLWK